MSNPGSAFLPLAFEWEGDVMRPLRPKAADAQYVVGEKYMLDVREDRSLPSHRHYFACIREAWANLPEHLAERHASAEHLRKWALIQAGYRDERTIVCASQAEAQRVAAFIRPIDEYAVVVTRGNVVIHYTAKSQSMRAMDKKTFRASKDAVLDIIAGLIKTDTATLRKNAERAA